MTTKDQVIKLHNANPTWTARQIADQLDCMPEYVRATASRNRLKLPRQNNRRRTPAQLRQEADQLIKRAERLEAEEREK